MTLEDAVWSLFWLGATYLVVRTGARIARHAFPRDTPAQRTLHISTFAIALCILNLTVVGAFEVLSRTSILAGAVITSLLGGLIRLRPSTWNTSVGEPTGAAWVWGALGSVVCGHAVVHGLFRFPTDWDCLTYHMPMIDHWLQSGALSGTDSARWSSPANSELLGLWFAGAFTGDILVSLNNLPVVIVWAAGLLELARHLGIVGWWRHSAAIACMAVYTTVHETDDASNDLMVVAFFISGLAYAFRYQRSSARSDLVLFGLSLGILTGTKYFAAGYSLVLGTAFAAMSLKSFGCRRALVAGCVAIAASLVVGGYWYGRNFWMTGHPFFPLGSPVLNDLISQTDMSKTTLAFNGDPSVPALALDAVWKQCGPLHTIAILMLPGLIVGLLYTAARNGVGSTRDSRPRWILLLCLLGTLSVVLVTPFLVENQPGTLNHLRNGYTPVRYSLCFLCMALLSLAVLLQTAAERLPPSLSRLAPAVSALAAIGQFLHVFWSRPKLDMSFALGVGLLLILLLTGCIWLWRRSSWGKVLTIALVATSVSISTALLSRRWHQGFANHFDGFYRTQIFFTLHQGNPERILVLDERSYAFFGSRRQHFVTQPRRFHGIEQVKNSMTEENLSLAVARVAESGEIRPYRPAWDELEADPAFKLIGKGRQLRLFRFRPGNP